jgi:hypothetical protein
MDVKQIRVVYSKDRRIIKKPLKQLLRTGVCSNGFSRQETVEALYRAVQYGAVTMNGRLLVCSNGFSRQPDVSLYQVEGEEAGFRASTQPTPLLRFCFMLQ